MGASGLTGVNGTSLVDPVYTSMSLSDSITYDAVWGAR